mmetsp:Transcript_26853/g.39802  ORF Transcript_26853/g.39802 Transcript_26853/m.39802 type:complete len:159 (-) Transcript_26853:152-628(-)
MGDSAASDLIDMKSLDFQLLYALEVQAPFSQKILHRAKTIETRAYPLPDYLIHVPILLLESEPGIACHSSLENNIVTGSNSSSCRIIGTVTFSESKKYSSCQEWVDERDRHLVPENSHYDWTDNSEKYGWIVENTSEECCNASLKLTRVFRSIFRVSD